LEGVSALANFNFAALEVTEGASIEQQKVHIFHHMHMPGNKQLFR